MMSKRSAILAKSGERCWYCGCVLGDPEAGGSPKSFTIDHLIPKAKGGSSNPNNLVASCKSCNSRKRDKTLGEYRHALLSEQEAVRLSSLIDEISSSRLLTADQKAALSGIAKHLKYKAQPVVFYGERGRA